MGYSDLIDRSTPGGGALVPPEMMQEIFKQAETMSAALRFFRKIPIRTQSKSIPIMSALPSAYWIGNDGQDDTALIQTTELAWKNVSMEVADIGVIVPLPRRLLNDIQDPQGGFNLTQEIRPAVAAAIARKIDQAIFFGTGKPSVWPDSVLTGATNAGNVKTFGASAANGGMHSDIIALVKMVRQNGFNVNAGIGRPGFEYDLMDARDTTGQSLMTVDTLTPGNNANILGNVLGREVSFATDGVWPAQDVDAADPELILFDASKHIIGIREEINFQVSTDGVIQDGTGAIQYNLLQQDMIALRFIMRLGYAVANPVTVAQPTEGSRYPGGVLMSADETP